MTEPSLIRSEKSALDFLDARDSRQDALTQVLSRGYPAVLFVSLNIPGYEKTPPGSEALFLWVSGELEKVFPERHVLKTAHDALGPYALLAIEADAQGVKRRCIEIESSHPSARLVDLDVYSAAGMQIDRGSLGLPSRTCLACNAPAVECMRTKRHSFEQVISKVHELLIPFRA